MSNCDKLEFVMKFDLQKMSISYVFYQHFVTFSWIIHFNVVSQYRMFEQVDENLS